MGLQRVGHSWVTEQQQIFMSEVVDISPDNLDSNLWFIQTTISPGVLCTEVKYAGWQYTALLYYFPNFKPVRCSMCHSNCCFLICIQVSQEAGKMVWYFHLFDNFLEFIVIHTVKGFNIVNETEIDVFLGFSCFFYDPTDVGDLISVSSMFSKSSLYIWKFSVHILLNPSLKDFEHYLAIMWNECNCIVVWTFFDIALLWDWNENCCIKKSDSNCAKI